MDKSATISAVIISCNEASVIESCLQSVIKWVDDIVVVDMHSTDGTREIAARYGARIIDHDRLTYADPARDFAFAQARGDWILMLDPDERVQPRLGAELRRIVDEDEVDVVTIPRQQLMFGTIVHSPAAADGEHPRFFRRGVLSWPPEVHGRPDLAGLRCQRIPSGISELALLHDTWRTPAVVLDKLSRYVPQDAGRMRIRGERFTVAGMMRVALGVFGNKLADGRAYEDGMAGLLMALYWSIYHLSIHAELWLDEGKPTHADQQVRAWGGQLVRAYVICRAIYRRIRHTRTLVMRVIASLREESGDTGEQSNPTMPMESQYQDQPV